MSLFHCNHAEELTCRDFIYWWVIGRMCSNINKNIFLVNFCIPKINFNFRLIFSGNFLWLIKKNLRHSKLRMNFSFVPSRKSFELTEKITHIDTKIYAKFRVIRLQFEWSESLSIKNLKKDYTFSIKYIDVVFCLYFFN